VLWIVLVGHLNPYIDKWWITVSGAAGLESVARKKKKKKQDKIIPLNVVVQYIICYQYGSSSMQGKGVDI